MAQPRLLFSLLAAATLTACGSKGTKSPNPSYLASVDSETLRTCDKVLDAELIDTVISYGRSNQRELLIARFFTMSEEDAYNLYNEARIKNESGNPNLAFLLQMLPLNASNEANVSLDEFVKEYRRVKAIFSDHVDTNQFKDVHSLYSTLGDDSAMRAWSRCIQDLKGDPFAPVLEAVLVRRNTKRAILFLTYSGGRFSALVPSLKLELVGAKPVSGTDIIMPLGEKIIEVEIGADATKIAINGTDRNSAAGEASVTFSQTLYLPAAPERLDQLRCQIYTTAWYAAGRVHPEFFELYKKLGWVLAPQITSEGRAIGTDDCWIILDGVKPFGLEEDGQ